MFHFIKIRIDDFVQFVIFLWILRNWILFDAILARNKMKIGYSWTFMNVASYFSHSLHVYASTYFTYSSVTGLPKINLNLQCELTWFWKDFSLFGSLASPQWKNKCHFAVTRNSNNGRPHAKIVITSQFS